MILDFTTLSDEQIRHLLRFLKADIIEKGEIERYILKGKCIKIKISYHDIITIEPERIIFDPEIGSPQVILNVENIQHCVNLYQALIENNN